MSDLEPLEMLYEWDRGGEDLPLPPGLSALYGPLRFPPHPDRPYVVGNFVTSLDGVAALEEPGYAGGGPISGHNPHDRMVMGMLRAVADAVIVGAGTQRAANPHHLCTEMRGVRGTSAQTRTTFWRGEYAENAGLRAEFFTACGLQR